MENIAVRIFGTDSCIKCQALKKAFDFYSIKYEYVDANDADNQKFCDDHNVDELPHIEAYYPRINKVFYVRTGYVSPIQFLESSIKETESLKAELLGDKSDDVTDFGKKEIQKMLKEIQSEKKCGCNRKKESENNTEEKRNEVTTDAEHKI
jgi:hypothetical protein